MTNEYNDNIFENSRVNVKRSMSFSTFKFTLIAADLALIAFQWFSSFNRIHNNW